MCARHVLSVHLKELSIPCHIKCVTQAFLFHAYGLQGTVQLSMCLSLHLFTVTSCSDRPVRVPPRHFVHLLGSDAPLWSKTNPSFSRVAILSPFSNRYLSFIPLLSSLWCLSRFKSLLSSVLLSCSDFSHSTFCYSQTTMSLPRAVEDLQNFNQELLSSAVIRTLRFFPWSAFSI